MTRSAGPSPAGPKKRKTSTSGNITSIPGCRGEACRSFSPHIIADDLKSLKGISKGEFLESGSWMVEESGTLPTRINFPGMQHLNFYITARLYWDTHLDVDQLVNEYCEKFYGPGGKDMLGFWKTAEDIWMTKSTRGNPVNIYKKDDLDKLTACLENAKKNTPTGSVYRKRVELIETEFTPARRALSNVLVLNPPKLTVPGPSPGRAAGRRA